MALTDSPVTSENLTATGTTTMSASTVTTFSPAAGAMVQVSLDWLFNSGGAPTTITIADSHGNSYNSLIQAPNSFNVAGSAFFWFEYATAPGSTTLTITSSASSTASGGTEFLVSPTITTGQKAGASKYGPNMINIAPSGSTTALSGSLTTTVTGSRVYMAGGIESGSTLTAVAGTTTRATFNGFNNAITGIATALTVTPGATTFGFTASPAAAFGGNLLAVELLPASGTPHTLAAPLTVTPSRAAALQRTPAALHLAAALTVTPSRVAALRRGQVITAALIVTPSRAAALRRGQAVHAALTVTPSRVAALRRGQAIHAALTVTPSRAAALRRGQAIHAALTVTPVRAAALQRTPAALHLAAALTVTPSRAAALQVGGPHNLAAALTVTPSRAAALRRGQLLRATLTVTPSRAAAISAGGVTRTLAAALTVTPSRAAALQRGQRLTAALTVTPARSATLAAGGAVRPLTAALTVTPSRAAGLNTGHHRGAALTVTPVRRATISNGRSSGAPAPDGPPDYEPPFRWKVWL